MEVGALLDVGTGLHPELTGRENVYLMGSVLGMRRAAVRRRFDEIVSSPGWSVSQHPGQALFKRDADAARIRNCRSYRAADHGRRRGARRR